MDNDNNTGGATTPEEGASAPQEESKPAEGTTPAEGEEQAV